MKSGRMQSNKQSLTTSALPRSLRPTLKFRVRVKDSGKENGNYYSIIGFKLGLYWDNGNQMETVLMGCMGLFKGYLGFRVQLKGELSTFDNSIAYRALSCVRATPFAPIPTK